MKAVGYRKSYPIDHPEALLDIELPEPSPGGHDILVEVRAVSVNPVDTKIRRSAGPLDGEYRVLGWDAAGVVREVGGHVTLFKPGDRVMYAGTLLRPGTNSELHLVDERIVGRMPSSLGFEEAAALPLTSLTAWELLFDRLQVAQDKAAQPGPLLVIGAGGGVGSIMVQLARQLTALVVIGTASRERTQEWVRELGAHYVIDHNRDMLQQLVDVGIGHVRYVASLTHSDTHLPQVAEALAPQGKLGIIDDPESFDIKKLKRKSISLHWEFMYTRSMFQTADMIEQHHILDRIADLVDSGVLRTTLAEHFGTINAANLRRAHQLLESGQSRGKIVLSGF
ncbi:zinc-binding alcohol dehydrogenase family protein [Massilia horti]|uniref:Zinc-type alcohol dehydrogenase-like protein n=1 Tax=Massilia horti TaxID=2562153 RepID=A0A4Y9T4G1_9BURK|nr:zinc-binding alcohol dehydrogenase family protein [Massilia horti]TFW34550.1 zinc-binding alcohol dehydrogenase family protein [Massilia horti]